MMNEELKSFIEIYPNFKQCSLQTFDDDGQRKDGRLARILENNEKSYEKLDELNKQGAGIFFSVNPMKQGLRGIDNTTGINVWICEIDGLDKKTQEKMINNCPLKPSLIIESKSSFHMYWYSKDGTIDNWKKICNGLRNYFDGDHKVIEISRVLRLPGYNHLKNQDDPFFISIYYYENIKYTEEQMLKSYPDTRSVLDIKQSIEEKENKAKVSIGGDYFWERVKNMDSKTMLEKVSGSKWVMGEVFTFHRNNNGTEQIFCNGIASSSWIDKQGKIGSGDGGGPNWTNWVFWYGLCSGSEMAKWIKDNYPEMCESKVIPQSQQEYIKVGYEYPSDVFEPFDCFMSGELVTIVAESNSGKTTFAMDIIQKNAELGKKGFYINLEFAIETMWQSRWLWLNGKKKRHLTDLVPLTDIEKNKMDEYVKNKLSKFDYYNNPKGIELESLVNLIIEKKKQGYGLIVIDTFSKINGNLNAQTARTSQNKCMEVLQDLVQKIGVALVLLHHTNRAGTFEGSQKIMDLSNVFIVMTKAEDGAGESYRTFSLSKDKYVSSIDIDVYYRNQEYFKS